MLAGPSLLIWPCGALGGVARDRQVRVDQEVEPVGGLLDLGTALGPDRAVVPARRQDGLDIVGDLGEQRPRRCLGEMVGLVGEEILAVSLGQDIALAVVGPEARRKPLGEPSRRRYAIEIDQRPPADEVDLAISPDRQPVDLLEAARPVGIEALPGDFAARAGRLLLPGRTVPLQSHVGERVEAVLGRQLDRVDGLVGLARALATELPVRPDETVRRPVEFGRIGFEWMGRELLDIDRHGAPPAVEPAGGRRRVRCRPRPSAAPTPGAGAPCWT